MQSFEQKVLKGLRLAAGAQSVCLQHFLWLQPDIQQHVPQAPRSAAEESVSAGDHHRQSKDPSLQEPL